MAPLSRRGFVLTVGGTIAGVAAGPQSALAAVAPALVADEYSEKFLDMYKKIKSPASGYFSKQGVPYHAVETLMVEAPDHGHETTSEAFSYWMWLEATYGRVTGDWAPFNASWVATEKYIIPTKADQPTNASYNPLAPATYAPEHAEVSGYPSALDKNVPVGQDPIANELKA